MKKLASQQRKIIQYYQIKRRIFRDPRSPTTVSTVLKKRPLGAAREYRRDKKLPLRKRSSSGFPTVALKPTSPKGEPLRPYNFLPVRHCCFTDVGVVIEKTFRRTGYLVTSSSSRDRTGLLAKIIFPFLSSVFLYFNLKLVSRLVSASLQSFEINSKEEYRYLSLSR